MSAEINVLCGFDDAYAPHFATMVSSLFATARNSRKIRIHLISNLLSAAIRARLDDVFARYGTQGIRWLEVDVSPFLDAPLSLHFTRATYARIAAFDVLPTERVLYLDVDLLCLADVAEFHDSALNENVLGAVMDPNSTFDDPRGSFDAREHKALLGIAPDATCFNGGVLVVDVAGWKRERMTQACLKFLEEKRSVIRWVDQDVLNGVLARRWLKLESVWNAQTHFWKPRVRDQLATMMPNELGVTRAPKIVHFNDPQKPWQFGYRHPYREMYLQYLARSGWPHAVRSGVRNGVRDQFVQFE